MSHNDGTEWDINHSTSQQVTVFIPPAVLLSQAQSVSHFRHIFRIFPIHLIQVLQADAVLLRNGVHGVSVSHDINGVGLGGFLAFSFQIDNVAGLQSIVFMQVIIFHQFPPADVELLAQELESVSVTSHNIGNVIGNIHLMRIGKPGLLLQLLLQIAGFPVAQAARVILI